MCEILLTVSLPLIYRIFYRLFTAYHRLFTLLGQLQANCKEINTSSSGSKSTSNADELQHTVSNEPLGGDAAAAAAAAAINTAASSLATTSIELVAAASLESSLTSSSSSAALAPPVQQVQVHPLAVGARGEATGYGYAFGRGNHPLPDFLRGCEDRPATMGEPGPAPADHVHPSALVSYKVPAPAVGLSLSMPLSYDRYLLCFGCCVLVCVYVCMCICMYVCIYVCVYVWIYVCMCVWCS